ncbi:accessory gene regulator B family protein [Pseudobacteroides cellulosolvens]|uniref:accessory gene regulator B family protein n=1 Tax=Pseudobacteroides cellulosolvens TaxID=35825 RepID=UPI00191C3E54|nr:accessory gene regulator B family protein [Pseudobacteroides cellulosolvens]
MMFETNITEKLANILTLKLNKHLKKEGLEFMKMKLGVEIVFINITKFIVVFTVAALLNLLKEALFMCLIFGSVRRSGFGLHAKNSTVCTLVTLLMFIGGSYISYSIKLNNYFVFGMFLLLNLLLFKYAPGDTENHPILGKKTREKLRKQTVTVGILLMILAMIIPSQLIKSLITLSVSYEVISILPITYKILNRGYKNYEKYERANS